MVISSHKNIIIQDSGNGHLSIRVSVLSTRDWQMCRKLVFQAEATDRKLFNMKPNVLKLVFQKWKLDSRDYVILPKTVILIRNMYGPEMVTLSLILSNRPTYCVLYTLIDPI